MWIWLTVSLLLVIACVIFGIHSFRSSRSLQKSISRDPGDKKNNLPSRTNENGFPVQQHNLSNLKIKFKPIEENSVLHLQQLNALQKRIEALEEGNNFKADDGKWNENDEDWEKLYYASRREKELLENELDITKEDLGEARLKLGEFEKLQAAWVQMKSDAEAKLTEAHSLQNNIEELQRKLEGAANREEELQQQIADEKYIHAEYELLKNQNNQLRSETDELTNRLREINGRNIIMDQKIKRLTELESCLEISEYERQEIKKSVDQIVTENITLSKRLRELQFKLPDEKEIL